MFYVLLLLVALTVFSGCRIIRGGGTTMITFRWKSQKAKKELLLS